ncbi:MAG: DUF2808 domain-containing protein [Phormidesmis sp.]
MPSPLRSFCPLAIALTLLPGALALSAIAQTNNPSQIEAPSAPSESDLTPATNPAISFRRPLRVNSVRVPTSWQYRRSEYLFTLDFPAEAVEPLQKIVFEQVEGVDYPRYDTDDSYAFVANSRTRLPIKVTNNRDQRTLTVEFDPPVAPGGDITIALRARNPRDGIYVYQLAAYPAGATEGQYAGVERLNFYAPRRRFRWY